MLNGFLYRALAIVGLDNAVVVRLVKGAIVVALAAGLSAFVAEVKVWDSTGDAPGWIAVIAIPGLLALEKLFSKPTP